METLEQKNLMLDAYLHKIGIIITGLQRNPQHYFTAEFCDEVVGFIQELLISGIVPQWVAIEVLHKYLRKEDTIITLTFKEL